MCELQCDSVESLINLISEENDDVRYTITWEGKYSNRINPLMLVYGYNENLNDVLKNTLLYIERNFEEIYINILSAMIPKLKEWEIHNKRNGDLITDIDALDSAKLKEDFIEAIQINCDDVDNGYAYYSIIFRLDYLNYGYDDGMEIVMFKDKVVYWSDGNTWEYIFDFRSHSQEDTFYL